MTSEHKRPWTALMLDDGCAADVHDEEGFEMMRSAHISDARLIAAAPELSEALEQILDDMGKDGLSCCLSAKKQAIAALAKARGKS